MSRSFYRDWQLSSSNSAHADNANLEIYYAFITSCLVEKSRCDYEENINIIFFVPVIKYLGICFCDTLSPISSEFRWALVLPSKLLSINCPGRSWWKKLTFPHPHLCPPSLSASSTVSNIDIRLTNGWKLTSYAYLCEKYLDSRLSLSVRVSPRAVCTTCTKNSKRQFYCHITRHLD